MTDDVIAVAVRAVGAALLHSMWQGTLIAAFVAAALHILRHHSAQTRYVIACAGLAAMIGVWALTAHAVVRAHGSFVEAGSSVLPSSTVEPALREAPEPVPAIRVFASSEALDAAVAPRVSWRQRLDVWSVSLVPFWLAGVLLFAVRLLLSSVDLARLRRRPSVAVPAAIERRARDLATRLDIRRVVRVVESASVGVPVVVGWLKPVVMLPASTIAGLSPVQLESILAHELAHVRRHDVLVNAVQSVIDVVLFYHPACWWISARIRTEREHCCDDVAVAACGDGVVYASALADLESNRNAARLAASAADGALYDRVRRVLERPDGTGEHAGKALPATILAVVAILAVGTLTGRASGADGQATVPTPGRSIPADQVVLQGRVVEIGSARPVAGARVQAMSLNGTFEATTDADGRYEIASMLPDSYTVAARAKGFTDGYYGRDAGMTQDFGAQVVARGGRVTAGIDVRLQPAGHVGGRILDEKGRGLAGVEIELVRQTLSSGDTVYTRGVVAYAQTVEGGAYDLVDVAPGDYVVRAYVGPDSTLAPEGTTLYAPTFYPGVDDCNSAQTLRVYAGQGLLDVDFALSTTRLFNVAGTIVDETGGSLEGLVVRLSMVPTGARRQGSTGIIDAKGRFELHDVFPGTYMAHIAERSPKPGPPMPGTLGRLAPFSWMLTVDADVSDLVWRVTPPARVSFSLVPAVGVTRTFENATVGLGIVREEGGGPGLQMNTFGKMLTRDGAAVELPLTPGPVYFKVETPAGWMVKAIRLDGRDVEDGPVELASGHREVEAVLTDRVSGMSGVVVDRRGRPMPNYSVVVFPPDPARWHWSSRAIRQERTDNDGRFRIDALPPGAYRAVAVPALARTAIEKSEVLERLEGTSEGIRLDEGQHLAVSIRASALPDGLAP